MTIGALRAALRRRLTAVTGETRGRSAPGRVCRGENDDGRRKAPAVGKRC
jgi:hypothetical protein